MAQDITADDEEELTATPPATNDPFNFTSKAALLIDSDTGTVLYEKNADTKLPVASVTKVMTLLLTFEALEQQKFGLDDTITVSQHAAGMGGSQALLDANGKYKASELIKSIIVASANDSSVAMAEYLYGSESLFVDAMNKRAEELGMENTHFVNCTGLPVEGQYTSVADVSIMSRELIKYPMFYQYSKVWMYEMQHSNGRITQLSNTNKLTRFYDGCDGIKTGSTDEAGFCLTATAKRGDSRFIAVIAGATTSVDRNASISKMLDYAFATYKNVALFDEGSIVQSNVVVWGGQLSAVNAITMDKISVLVKKGEENKVDKIVEIFQPVHAPVELGAQIGTVKVLKGGQQIAEYPLIADRTVDEAGFWTNIVKILDTLK
jgi:serine-type D-Ala-D-Ala carboxypeptidase (penicillin-binding protein 5/6)